MGRKLRILSMFSVPLPFLFDEDCKIMNDIGWQRSNKKSALLERLFCNNIKMAERTGLEPATHGVTGRYSNQLNYRSKNFDVPRHIYKLYSYKPYCLHKKGTYY